METHQHFGLSAAPFEGRPDPRFYYAAAGHAEALAALQYAVHAGKSCTLVLGEAGSGKTLLARVLLRGVCRKSVVGWIQGLGQPEARTEITICPQPPPGPVNPLTHPKARHVHLADWTRTELSASPATTIIVDDADGLQPHNWQDVLALVTREDRARGPLSLVLFGLPLLLDSLAEPPLVRLQRRVFRTYRLAPLSRNEVGDYVRHRLCVAGGDGGELFTGAAFDLIHRFSSGNPALINQLCDNAMVEAFGEERHVIDARHVVGTVQAITGGVRKQRYLPSPTPTARRLAARPGLSPDEGLATRLRRALTDARPESFSPVIEPEFAAAETPAIKPVSERELADEQAPPLDQYPADEPLAPEPPPFECARDDEEQGEFEDEAPPLEAEPDEFEDYEAEDPPMDERLRALEQRLSAAIARVREARRQPLASPKSASGSPLAMDARVPDSAADEMGLSDSASGVLSRESTP